MRPNGNALGSTWDGAGFIFVKIDSSIQPLATKALPGSRRMTLKKIRDAVSAEMLAPTTSQLRYQQNVGGSIYKFSKDGKPMPADTWLLTLVHEMGHQIHYAAGTPRSANIIKDMKNKRFKYEPLKHTPSGYARSNDKEYFAEAFMQYTLGPKALKKASPEAYKWVDKIVKKALTGVYKGGAKTPSPDSSTVKPTSKKPAWASFDNFVPSWLKKTLTSKKPTKKTPTSEEPTSVLMARTGLLIAQTKATPKAIAAEAQRSIEPFKTAPISKVRTAAALSGKISAKTIKNANRNELIKIIETNQVASLTKETTARVKLSEKILTKTLAFNGLGPPEKGILKKWDDPTYMTGAKALVAAPITQKIDGRNVPVSSAVKKDGNDKLTKEVDKRYDDALWSKPNSKNPFAYKTKAEWLAAKDLVKDWTGEYYASIRAVQLWQAQKAGKTLNWNHLRAIENHKAFVSTSARASAHIAGDANKLEDFVRRAPKYDGEIYRGLSLKNNSMVSKIIESYKRGDASLTLESWTSNKTYGMKFAKGDEGGGYTGGGPVMGFKHQLIIKQRNRFGVPINSLSDKKEWEVLQPRGVRYKVISTKTKRLKDGQTLTEIEVAPLPNQTAKKPTSKTSTKADSKNVGSTKAPDKAPSTMTIIQLKAAAKAAGLKGYSTKKKADLVKMVEGATQPTQVFAGPGRREKTEEEKKAWRMKTMKSMQGDIKKPDPESYEWVNQMIKKGGETLESIAPELAKYDKHMAKSAKAKDVLYKQIYKAKTKAEKKPFLDQMKKLLKSDGEVYKTIDGTMSKIRKEMLETDLDNATLTKQVDSLKYVGFPGTGGAKRLAILKNNVSEFARMMNGRSLQKSLESSPVYEIEETMFRASNKWGKIKVKSDDKRVLFHEMMHTVEHQNPGMAEWARVWAADKAFGEKHKSSVSKGLKMEDEGFVSEIVNNEFGKPVFRLNKILPNRMFDSSEMGWHNSYLKPYMGKFYHEKDTSRPSSTEVWSVAAEYFAEGPAEMSHLYHRHPELFKAFVGLASSPEKSLALGNL